MGEDEVILVFDPRTNQYLATGLSTPAGWDKGSCPLGSAI
jgi:hypothetical protein